MVKMVKGMGCKLSKEWNAVQKKGAVLEYASENLRNDRELVMKTVQQNGFALEYASEELRNDRKIVKTAVQQYGDALQFASEDLKKILSS